MSDGKRRGQFVWHDLMTSDPQAAMTFYTKVVGWGTQPWEGSPTPYTMWTANGVPLGGVMAQPPGSPAPPHWLGYTGTPNIDETVKEATRRGASVFVPPTDIPTVGRFAVLADPQGAAFAGFTSLADAPGHDGEPAVGEFSWHELATTDPVAGLEFYIALFGWQKTESMEMGDMGTYQMFGLAGRTFGGIFKKPADMPGPPTWCHYARVDDIGRAESAVKSGGAQIVNGPMEVPGGDMIFQGVDPQGAFFAVHAKKK